MKLREVVHIGNSALKMQQHKNQESKVSIAIYQIEDSLGYMNPSLKQTPKRKEFLKLYGGVRWN